MILEFFKIQRICAMNVFFQIFHIATIYSFTITLGDHFAKSLWIFEARWRVFVPFYSHCEDQYLPICEVRYETFVGFFKVRHLGLSLGVRRDPSRKLCRVTRASLRNESWKPSERT
jgi:hypothetical protein